jgi:hypothetical protein
MTNELGVMEGGAGSAPTSIPNSFHRVSADFALPQSWKARMGGTAVIAGALAIGVLLIYSRQRCRNRRVRESKQS